jgi:replication factor C small subunit
MTELWVEKYRPKSLDDVIGQDLVVKRLKQYKSINELPHCLFVGSPGTGKTATAHALANDLGVGIVEWNASDNRGIDFIRTKVKEALETLPAKIVLLDEADALTPDAQHALRRIMERAINSTPNRLIMTANYGSKIIAPDQSRCSIFYFRQLSRDDLRQILLKIVVSEGIATALGDTKEDIYQILDYVIDMCNGDARRAIQTLQDIYKLGDRKLMRETVEYYFASTKTAVLAVKRAMEGNWQEALNLLETALVRGASVDRVVMELYEASKIIEEPVLKAKYLESLARAEDALSSGRGSPLIQLTSVLMNLYVYAHAIPRLSQNNIQALSR